MKSAFAAILLTVSMYSFTSSATAPVVPEYRLKWILVHEPIRVFQRAAKHFADNVAKETGGKVAIEIVSGSALNGGKKMTTEQAFQMVKSGKIEMTQTYSTFLGNYSAPLWALDLPFLFRSHEHAAKVLDGKTGEKLMAGLNSSNIKGLSFTYSGGYMILPTQKTEILKIEDFAGLKISVNNDSPVGSALMKELGAVPVPGTPEKLRGLDGFETTYARFLAVNPKVQENKKIINDLQHSLFLTAILINKDYFDKIPEEYRRAIEKAARAAAIIEREDSIQDSVTVKNSYSAKGFKIVTMSAEETARFKAAAAPVYTKFETIVGKDLIKEIQGQ